MAFGYKSNPSRRYAYHCIRGPWTADQTLLDQLWKAHRFQNALVEIELTRRQDVRAAAVAASPTLEQAEAAVLVAGEALEAGEDRLAETKVVTRSAAGDPAVAAEVRALRAAVRTARATAKAARDLAYQTPAARKAIKDITETAGRAVAAARTAAVADGLYWATAADVMTRVKPTGRPPRFKRYDGEGSLSIQFQRKGLTGGERVPVLRADGTQKVHARTGRPVTRAAAARPFGESELFTGCSLIRFERVRHPVTGEAHRKNVTVHWRAASTPDGKPVTVAVGPVVYHRPVPPDAVVKWAHLIRRRVGTQFRWELQLVLARPAWPKFPAGRTRAATGTVAVALGWRRVDGGVRAAYWVGDDGREGEIVIPDEQVARWRTAEGIRSVRDVNFNATRAALSDWLALTPVPLEFAERAANLDRWRSPARLGRLVGWWRNNRVPGDDDIFRRVAGELETVGPKGPAPAYRESPSRRRGREAGRQYTGGDAQDRHLADWEGFTRRRARRQRRAAYYAAAIALAEQYRQVAVAEIDWHRLGRNHNPEDADEAVNKTNRGVAASATLRDRLTTYMDEVKVDAAGVAATCATCGSPVALGPGRWVVCERCDGAREDRGRNAARNILKRCCG